MSREGNIDGTLHVTGGCCGDGLNELRRCRAQGCNGTVHTQGTTFGLVLSCDACPGRASHWKPRGTYHTDDMVNGCGKPMSSVIGLIEAREK